MLLSAVMSTTDAGKVILSGIIVMGVVAFLVSRRKL